MKKCVCARCVVGDLCHVTWHNLMALFSFISIIILNRALISCRWFVRSFVSVQ